MNRFGRIIAEKFEGKQVRLAKAAGIPASSLPNYISERSLPGFDHIVKICNAADVNYEWFITGEGPMERDFTPAPEPDAAQVKEMGRLENQNRVLSEMLILLKEKLDATEKRVTALEDGGAKSPRKRA